MSLACAHYADCHCLLSSLCCLLVCAASTQGSSSDDSTWHAEAWRPCYSSKSRARELASNPLKGEPLCKGTLQAANASARAVLNHVMEGRARWEDLSQCRRIRKTCATCLSLACAHDADCHCLVSSLCCLSDLRSKHPGKLL